MLFYLSCHFPFYKHFHVLMNLMLLCILDAYVSATYPQQVLNLIKPAVNNIGKFSPLLQLFYVNKVTAIVSDNYICKTLAHKCT